MELNLTTDLIIPSTNANIKAMKRSLLKFGQITPIKVRRHGNKWWVVDGAARVAAAKSLGWITVEAVE